MKTNHDLQIRNAKNLLGYAIVIAAVATVADSFTPQLGPGNLDRVRGWQGEAVDALLAHSWTHREIEAFRSGVLKAAEAVMLEILRFDRTSCECELVASYLFSALFSTLIAQIILILTQRHHPDLDVVKFTAHAMQPDGGATAELLASFEVLTPAARLGNLAQN